MGVHLLPTLLSTCQWVPDVHYCSELRTSRQESLAFPVVLPSSRWVDVSRYSSKSRR